MKVIHSQLSILFSFVFAFPRRFLHLAIVQSKADFFRVGDRAQCLTTASAGGEKESEFLPEANGNKMLGSKWFSGDKNVVG